MANPYFNAKFYAASNPDLAQAGLVTAEDLWNHYVQFGAGEAVNGAAFPARSPAPWYDAAYYFQANPDLQAANLTPAQLFEHFITYGIAEGRAPREDFGLTDVQLVAYANANADLRTAFDITNTASMTDEQKTSLASHFFAYGYKEDRPGEPYNAFKGQPLSTTVGADNLVGTNLDDVFSASVALSLESIDTLDGRFGNDVLNIAAGAIGAAATPIIKGIETINNSDTTTLDLVNVSGVETINSLGATATYTNASVGTVFGTRAATSVVDVSFASDLSGAGDIVKVGVTAADVAGTLTAGVLTLTSAQATSIEGAVVTAAGGTTAAMNSADLSAFTALKSIVVNGTGSVTVVDAAALGLTSFDASAAKGAVTFTSGALTGDVTVKGGSGADILDFSAATAKVTVDGGAGNDTITVGAGGSSVTGGAGADGITLDTTAGADIIVFNARGDSIFSARDVITNFKAAGADKLDIKALNLAGDKATIANVNTNAPSVTAITEFSTTVENAFGAAAVGVWQGGGNTYVIADVNNDGHFNADIDFMVELAGTVTIATADIVFA